MSAFFPISQSARLSPVYVAAEGQTQFEAGFPAQADDDVIVYAVDAGGNHTTPWALGADYTVVNLAPATEALVVFNAGLAAGTRLRAAGGTVIERLSSITDSGKYRSAAVEKDLARATMIAQEYTRTQGGTLRAQPGETLPVMPPLADMAGRTVTINAAGDEVVAGPTYDEVVNAQAHAVAAAAALASFQSQYLGVHESDAAANAAALIPVAGMLYWNLFVGEMRVYTGAVWKVAYTDSFDVADYAALKALPHGVHNFVNAAGRETPGDGGGGGFVWRTGNFSAEIGTDPLGGIYVPDDADPGGLTGVWMRARFTFLNVKYWGAKFDWDDAAQTGTDDYGAIQATIDYSVLNGGWVWIPKGQARCTQMLVVDGKSVVISGVGGIAGHASGESASEIVADHSAGAVIRIMDVGCSVRDLGVSSSTARYSGAHGSNYGIWAEAADVAGPPAPQVNGTLILNVRITEQPNHGLVLIGAMSMSKLENVTVDNISNGHGIVIENGRITGRTNLERGGLVRLDNCNVIRTDGHGFVIGNAGGTNIDDMVRVEVNNLEANYNLEDHTKAIDGKLAANWIFGENIILQNCALQGKRSSDGADVHNCLYVAGRYHRYINNRYINANPYLMEIDNRTERDTVEILVDGGYVNNENQSNGFYNPAILVHDDATNVTVRMHSDSAFVTEWVSTTDEGVNAEVDVGSEFRSRKNYKILDLEVDGDQTTTGDSAVAGDSAVTGDHTVTGSSILDDVAADKIVSNNFLTSGGSIVLDDDGAGYLSFSGTAFDAVMVISGNVGTAGAAMAHFRVGSSGFVNIVTSSGATVTGGTGQLTGATGVDGEFTISADTVNNRLYLENRTGSGRTYRFFLMNIGSGNYTGYTAV